MRKLILSLGVFLSLSAAASAQTDEVREKGTFTKSGQQILPQAGDFAIGIDASPILKLGANAFNNSTDNNASDLFNGVDQTIYGKYFLKDNAALRFKFNFNIDSQSDKMEIGTSANSELMTEDVMKIKNNMFRLGLAYEMRRGYGRLQGFYGAGLEFAVGNIDNNRSFEYGNAITSDYKTPPSTNFVNNVNGGTRLLETKTGNFFGMGVIGFVGVEYFIAPKISLGAELGLGLGMNSHSKGESTAEYWDATTSAVKKETTKGKASASFSSLYTNTTGNLYVMFHF